MSDKKKFDFTPIVVGVVVGAIGVLAGLYVADNARQQLAAAQAAAEQAVDSTATVPAAMAHPAGIAPADTFGEELPAALDEPLPDVVVDALLPEEKTTVPETTTDEPTPPPAGETDSFEEVSAEELKAVADEPVGGDSVE